MTNINTNLLAAIVIQKDARAFGFRIFFFFYRREPVQGLFHFS